MFGQIALKWVFRTSRSCEVRWMGTDGNRVGPTAIPRLLKVMLFPGVLTIRPNIRSSDCITITLTGGNLHCGQQPHGV